MSTTYNYTRVLTDGVYDINNPRDVDSRGKAVLLATRINQDLPGKDFTIVMDGTSVDIIFDLELSGGDKTTLDATVATHQAANGMPIKQNLLNKVNIHSVKLDGVNDYLAVPATTDLQFERTDSFSFSFWLRPQTSATQAIYSAEITSGTFRGIAIRLIGQKLRFILTSTTATNQLSIETTGNYNFSQWQHFVITYDGSSSASGVTFYRDSVLKGSTTNTDNLSATIDYTGAIRIGSRTDGAQPYQNHMDEVAIFDTELDAADVMEIYGQRNFTDYTNLTKSENLIHGWRMGDGAKGSVVPDEIASADATITNNPGAIVSESP